ncbi:MAG TPA: ribbon-helix-helix domain-containing protein [Gammaproteobacteria bacterium]|jgi:metal-responsive CopG/Arc/MetJ family transcriptional regulator
MSRTKIAITVREDFLEEIDLLVSREVFPNRSRAIEQAIEEKLERHQRNRLAEECAKLEPRDEQAMAEEGLSAELAAWPEY